ncbi:MAG: AbrB/MazE/SpoVT family DNA-binding domain-containing protein [Candidatus Micrarchaeota archaeon]
MKCPNCYSNLKKGIVKEEYLGHSLGEYDGFTCSNCGETLLTEASVVKAQEKVKELGLFGLAQKTTIAKSGNSLIVRIKKNVADYLGLFEGEEVLVHPEGKKKIVIEVAN